VVIGANAQQHTGPALLPKPIPGLGQVGVVGGGNLGQGRQGGAFSPIRVGLGWIDEINPLEFMSRIRWVLGHPVLEIVFQSSGAVGMGSPGNRSG
jgi:hypothetical protein